MLTWPLCTWGKKFSVFPRAAVVQKVLAHSADMNSRDVRNSRAYWLG